MIEVLYTVFFFPFPFYFYFPEKEREKERKKEKANRAERRSFSRRPP